MTRYIDVNDVSKLVQDAGMTRVLTSMASYIEQDYRRWHTFEKTARLASYSTDGVIGETELHADVLRRARVIVEYEPQTRIEGDIQQLTPEFPVIEFHRVLSGEQKRREFPTQVTVFDSAGFALEDFSALRYLHAVARERDIGIELDLIPAPHDPKDLFGLAVGIRQDERVRPPVAEPSQTVIHQ